MRMSHAKSLIPKCNPKSMILTKSGNKCKDPTAILAESGTHAEDPTAILAESGDTYGGSM